VLLFASVMTMLAGAFLTLGRSQLALGGTVDQLDAADQACLSGVEYARMRLEHDATWGIPTGANSPPTLVHDHPLLRVWESRQNGTFHVAGIVENGRAAFCLDFLTAGQPLHSFTSYNLAGVLAGNWVPQTLEPQRASLNYLQAAAGSPTLSGSYVAKRSLPPRCVNLILRGASGRVTRGLDVTLRQRVLFPYSMAATGDVGVALTEEGRWQIDSTDPFNNRVVSNQNIYGPQVDATHAQMQFDATRGGSARSTQKIVLGGALSVAFDADGAVSVTASGGTDLQSESERARAGELAHGTFLPQAGDTQIPELNESDLKAPAGAQHQLPGGHYHFVGPDTVHYWSSPASTPGGTPERVFTQSIPDSGGNTAVTLRNRNFVVPDGSKVTLGGATKISGDNGGVTYVAIGYDADGALPDNASGMLRVDGDLVVEGSVVGAGALVTGENGALTLQGKSALAAPPDLGVALFAAGPIRMEPVSPLVSASTGPAESAYFELFKVALAQFESSPAHPHKGFTGSQLALNNWGSLPASEQVSAVTGGENGISDGVTPDPDHNNLRDVLIADVEVARLADALRGAFPVYAADTQVAAAFDQALTRYAAGQDGDGSALDDPGLSLGRFMHLALFLEQAQQAGGLPPSLNMLICDAGTGAIDGPNSSQIRARMQSLLTLFDEQARSGGGTLQSYVGQPQNPFLTATTNGASPRDGEFKGLLYTARDFHARMGGYRLSVEGSLIARGGSLVVEQASLLRNRFNAEYLDKLLRSRSAGSGPSLEVIWRSRF
jgi:hypothetical protein